MNLERESLIFAIINTDVIESFNIKNKFKKRKSNLTIINTDIIERSDIVTIIELFMKKI